MSAVLLDTHALVWNLDRPGSLSAAARAAIERASSVLVSPISFYEIGQKVRIGKWADVAPLLPRMEDVFLKRGGRTAPLGAEICRAAATMDWTHRDPFDRIIAATARTEGAALVSADAVFDGIPAVADRVMRVW